MRQRWLIVVLALAAPMVVAFGRAQAQAERNARPKPALSLQEKRGSALDLEVGGDLAGLPPGAVRYLTREDLQKLPQTSYVVTDDANFSAATGIRGVPLQILARELAADGEKALLVAICGDLYRAHYPRSYVQAHRPLLALEINGKGPAGWPKSKDGSSEMGPYLISHPHFAPSFKILGNDEEAQIPWGVVRLEFRAEQAVFGEISPPGPSAEDATVQAGYRIARENCLRCHGPSRYGRLKGQINWAGIAFFADASASEFAAYVRNPRRVAPSAQMPGNPQYSDETVQALIAYFRSFLAKAKS